MLKSAYSDNSLEHSDFVQELDSFVDADWEMGSSFHRLGQQLEAELMGLESPVEEAFEDTLFFFLAVPAQKIAGFAFYFLW